MANEVQQHDEHVDVNPSGNSTFDSILRARLSRRTLLRGSTGAVAGTFLGTSLMACGDDSWTPPVAEAEEKLTLNFPSVAKGRSPTRTRPRVRWRPPIPPTPASTTT